MDSGWAGMLFSVHIWFVLPLQFHSRRVPGLWVASSSCSSRHRPEAIFFHVKAVAEALVVGNSVGDGGGSGWVENGGVCCLVGAGGIVCAGGNDGMDNWRGVGAACIGGDDGISSWCGGGVVCDGSGGDGGGEVEDGPDAVGEEGVGGKEERAGIVS